MTIKEIKQRWFANSENENALDRILGVISKGGKIGAEHSPFELVDGYIDFRGLPLIKKKIKKIKVEKADFSYSSFNISWVERCTFNDTKFIEADLSEISDHENEFASVVFSSSKLRAAGIGYRGTHYTNCMFEKVNFSRAVFSHAEFDDCVFSDCKLRSIDFNASSFERCKFIGVLDDVWFRGGYPLKSLETHFGKARPNRMKDVSFEEASLTGTTFSDHCDLSSILLPKAGNYVLLSDWNRRLENLKPIISTWSPEDRKEAEIFVNSRLPHSKNQDWYLVNIDDEKKEFGSDRMDKILTELIK